MSPKRKPTILEHLEDKAVCVHKENAEIARNNRTLARELRDAQEAKAVLEKRLGLYERLEAAKVAPPEWLAPRSPGKGHRAIPSLAIADVHRGERVDPAQVDGVNAYSVAIADQRIRRAFEGAVTILRDYLQGVTYDGIQLLFPGDEVAGDIQQGRETNEETLADSILGWVEPVEAGINLLAREFGRVNVLGVPGNHPRNTLKPISKNRAADNWDSFAYRILARDYRNSKTVTVEASAAADAQVTLYGTRYLLTHGDQFHGGSGISGALAPLLLGAHRKTRRASASGHPYDVMVMGHFHQALFYPSKGIIVSGCVVGYNEYAYISNFEPEPPQCALWLTTPERGITVSAPVYVQDRAAEGW
jgi:predicted phosphodiesterase